MGPIEKYLEKVFDFLLKNSWMKAFFFIKEIQYTFHSIHKVNLKILYEKEVRLTWDNFHTPQPAAKNSWWNGIYLAILQIY